MGARPRHCGSEVARSSHLKRARMRVRQMRPPVGGDFWILKIAYAPSPKNVFKNGFRPQKGGSLCVEGGSAKKFQLIRRGPNRSS